MNDLTVKKKQTDGKLTRNDHVGLRPECLRKERDYLASISIIKDDEIVEEDNQNDDEVHGHLRKVNPD